MDRVGGYRCTARLDVGVIGLLALARRQLVINVFPVREIQRP